MAKREELGERVDMVELARENALADALLSRPGMIKVVAPAKVNLHLGVGQRRDDGFHDVVNVLHAVMLHDVVYVRSVAADEGSGRAISVVCTGAGGVTAPDIAPEQNIAYRAVEQLAEALGRSEDEQIEVFIEKRIPYQAGLGGGSSDAAATLVGMAQVWGIASDHPAIEQVARALGSDVAFFLKGGCALFDGAGERFVRSIAPRRDSIVIIKPEQGLSTADVYRTFDEQSTAVRSDAASAAALVADAAEEVPLENDLAAAAEHVMPELAEVRSWLAEQEGVGASMLCGSGSSSFALCDDFATACAVCAKAQARGWWARATSLSAARASVIPNE